MSAMNPRVLHETSYGFDAPGNVYELQRTCEVVSPLQLSPDVSGTSHVRKVRVTVHHNSSYPGQSRYYAEVWDGNRWNEVARIASEDPRLETMLISGWVPHRELPAKRQGADAMADVLLVMAQAVLGP